MSDIYGYLTYTISLIATSRFRDRMVLKGGVVLMSRLFEQGRTDMYRLTSDIDIHCDSVEVWKDFYTNIESILNHNDKGYKYSITKRRSSIKGLGSSDSLSFNLDDHGKNIKFKIDMNIKSNNIITVEYSPTLRMNTYDAVTMMTDKIVVVSSGKVYRRIKDLYDIAVLASMYSFDYMYLVQHLRVKHPRAELNNMLVADNFEQLNHAYSKYVGIRNKPEFNSLIKLCSSFLQPIYMKYNEGNLVWNMGTARWERFN